MEAKTIGLLYFEKTFSHTQPGLMLISEWKIYVRSLASDTLVMQCLLFKLGLFQRKHSPSGSPQEILTKNDLITNI